MHSSAYSQLPATNSANSIDSQLSDNSPNYPLRFVMEDPSVNKTSSASYRSPANPNPGPYDYRSTYQPAGSSPYYSPSFTPGAYGHAQSQTTYPYHSQSPGSYPSYHAPSDPYGSHASGQYPSNGQLLPHSGNPYDCPCGQCSSNRQGLHGHSKPYGLGSHYNSSPSSSYSQQYHYSSQLPVSHHQHSSHSSGHPYLDPSLIYSLDPSGQYTRH